LSAEAGTEVCGGGSTENFKEQSSTDVISPPADTKVVACQTGKFVKVEGKTYVRKVPGFHVHKGATCVAKACPAGTIFFSTSTAQPCRSHNDAATMALVVMIAHAAVVLVRQE